ncbi:EIF3D [Mytilus coruscus]|uniref:EIF3D n=1 Tax=Mytilus coruscus TaxID=42192 RepID=A0A6J8E7U4_MYTCO|nr:EIF3D [Mytilus coruscus]
MCVASEIRFEDQMFIDKIKSDINILLETWKGSCKDYNIEGFNCISKVRKKRKNARRHSGGIIVYYRKELEKGIQNIVIGTSSENRLWVKLGKNFFGFLEDVYMCAVYVPPISSVYSENDFMSLQNKISIFSGKGKILLLGDFNSRIGNKPAFVVQDSAEINRFDGSKLLPENYIIDDEIVRQNQDNIYNSQARKIENKLKEFENNIEFKEETDAAITCKENKQRKERERRQQQAQASMQVLSKTQKSRERDRQRLLRKWQKQFGKQQENRQKAPIRHRDASVQVKDDWAVVEDMDFPRLTKLSLPTLEEPEDLVKCGKMEYYDKVYDRVTTKNEKKLKRIDRIFHKVTTTDDPIIRQLAKTKGNVFATDAILATLMCCTRSTYSWDIIVQRVGKKLFFDKRDDSEFDLLSVSETATEPPQDEGNSINTPRNLALEATFINHNFSQQVLKQVCV